MASQCGLGRSRFAHYCEEITNLSPAKYLMRCRLERAAKLLRSEPLRAITEVAFDCGFESSQYFASVFHERFDCVPSEYRSGHEDGGSTRRPKPRPRGRARGLADCDS